MTETTILDISAAVANALYWDFAIPRYEVSASVERGWVTLRGDVERPYQKSCAEADVLRVHGVRGVTNQIVVIVPDDTKPQTLH